jgi:hypothetical protein
VNTMVERRERRKFIPSPFPASLPRARPASRCGSSPCSLRCAWLRSRFATLTPAAFSWRCEAIGTKDIS